MPNSVNVGGAEGASTVRESKVLVHAGASPTSSLVHTPKPMELGRHQVRYAGNDSARTKGRMSGVAGLSQACGEPFQVESKGIQILEMRGGEMSPAHAEQDYCERVRDTPSAHLPFHGRRSDHFQRRDEPSVNPRSVCSDRVADDKAALIGGSVARGRPSGSAPFIRSQQVHHVRINR